MAISQGYAGDFFDAVEFGDISYAKVILSSLHNTIPFDINATETDGTTTLMIAARYGHDDMVKLLLTHGADPKCVNSNVKTAQDIAEENGEDIVVNLIRDHLNRLNE
jgi:ankyrin repeat protein